MIKVTLGVMALSLMVVLGGFPAWGGEAVPLNDAQLDAVYGGETSGDVINCASLVCNSSPGSSVSLSGSAQANTNAMIIVNNAGGVVSAQVNVIVNNGGGNPTQTNMAFNTVGP